jgi:Cu(I)/Ag(I) efflux system membrane fusion protein
VESPTHELRVDVPPAFGDKINELVGPYLELVNSLAADDLENSRAAVTALRDQLERVDSDSLEPDAAQAWQLVSNSLHNALQTALDSAGIDTLRQQLVAITRDFERAVVSFVAGQVDALYRAHCPMAFGNQGADWLQADQAIANPYFGAKMLTCGEIRGQLP